jgi:hypothetical protein
MLAIADLMRVNKYRPVWVKSPQAQRQGRLLTARATLQSQLVALENTIRGLLRQEGIGLTERRTAFEATVREVIADDRLLQAAVLPLLETRTAVLQHRAALDRQILRIVRVDPVCRLLMTAAGVGAFVSLAFKVAVDDPRRLSRSRNVGAHFGLTPREHSWGQVSYRGRISKMGDREMRRLLYLAAARILRRDAALWCPLKVWAVRLAPGGSGSARRGWRWRASSRPCCTPCGATARSSNGGARRHRHSARTSGLFRVFAGSTLDTAVSFSREGGTGWDASEATRLVRTALRATPTTRMTPSCPNFPYPAPTAASKREEKAVTSGRLIAYRATGRHRSVTAVISVRRIVVRSAPAPASPAPSGHRYAAAGFNHVARPNERHPCL